MDRLRCPWLHTLLTVLMNLPDVFTWHDLTNTDYHCWPLSANANNQVPFPSCPGVHIHWLEAPPDEIKTYQDFNVTYELNLLPSFYAWAVDPTRDIFAAVGISNATIAQSWCESTQCPRSYTDAAADNCCIHHVNVHTCPLGETDLLDNGLCGPWIPASGNIFTHSEVLIGSSLVSNWSSHVKGLYHEGQTSLIAHFKVAGMHVALEKTISVLPRAVCGNGVCESAENEDCSTCPKDCGSCPLEAWEVGLIVTAVVLIVAILAGIVMYFQWQKRKLLWDESWIIPSDYIEDGNPRAAWGSMIGSFISMSNITHKSGKSLSIAQAGLQKQVFVRTAVVSGRTVAVKEIRKNQFSLTKTIRLEVKEVSARLGIVLLIRQCYGLKNGANPGIEHRRLNVQETVVPNENQTVLAKQWAMDHQNLCKFIAGCIDVPNVCILSEYCPKGSLADVLLNEDIPLSWSFRFSFATDIARGMAYLHSRKMFHGRLKSSNCVVDDRWTVKICDYGLETYRTEDVDPHDDAVAVAQDKRTRVYQPPEVIGGLIVLSAAADVYAFAILLVEIATRNGPFGDEDADNVEDNWKPPLPDLIEDKGDNLCPSPKKYLKLISECLDFYPHNRPTFEEAKRALHHMNPDKLSPVDLMMNMMEKYSKHLETVVAERTQDLVAEKQKTDRLLYSMLPKPVADELRLGQPVNAEMYSACTIYFSDIVGFTTLSGSSTPIQVVALLNKLYTCFDSVIDQYNVYKVETIGDAYMVVSGVPVVTPFHSKEVTSMALDLVKECRSFIIPHQPKEPLRIRVGIHSGPVCAGVVGLKMPRYCLFGDTVNTASRMESNGEAYKIHISNSTYVALSQFGGFTFEPRGTIAVKGKGDMKTWWVTGKTLPCEGTQQKLSGASDVFTESEHDGLSTDTPETNLTDLPGCVGGHEEDNGLSDGPG